MTLLRPELPPMIAGVPFHLALRDEPVTAALDGTQFSFAMLMAKRGSRQPETGGGFGEGEHYFAAFQTSSSFAALRRCAGVAFGSLATCSSPRMMRRPSSVSAMFPMSSTVHAPAYGVNRVLSS